MASTHYCAKCLTTFVDDASDCPNLGCGAPRPKKGWGILLGAGDTLDRHYQIIKPLAVGGAGLTYLARELDAEGNPTPPDLAIKVLYNQRDSGPFLRRLSTEAQILQDLAHDHIVQCRGFVHRTGHAPYLVTRFEHGGSLAGHVERHGPLPPRVAAGVLRQVLLALDVAHQRGVVHRDLKPENVLLADPVDRDVVPHVRVADFGIAKVFNAVGERITRLGAFVGTPEYAAPEQFEGIAPTPATDLFAAGGLLYFLLTGEPPLRYSHRIDIENSFQELLTQIPPQLPEPTRSGPRGPILQEVLDRLMTREPGDRWSVHQVLSHLGSIEADVDRLWDMVAAGRRSEQAATFTSWEAPELDPTPSPAPSRAGPPPPPPPPQPPPAAAAGLPKGAIPPVPPAHAEPNPTLAPPQLGAPPSPWGTAPASAPATNPQTTWVRTPSPAPPREPATPAPQPRRGRAAGMVGVAGFGAVALGAAVVCGLVLLGAAVAFGWFQGDPAPELVTLQSITVKGPPVVDITDTRDASFKAERNAMLTALRGSVRDRIATSCKPKRQVPLSIVVRTGGAVVSASVDGDTVAHKTAVCVERELASASLPRTSQGPVKLRTTIDF